MSDTVLQPQQPGIPTPTPSTASMPYWDACRQGELRFQRCRACGAVNTKPMRLCGTCAGDDLTWELSSGRGKLYS